MKKRALLHMTPRQLAHDHSDDRHFEDFFLLDLLGARNSMPI
jgi:hypothetical protein